MFYSKSTGGFYNKEIHGDNIPTDAVEITSEDHFKLLDGQSKGSFISSDQNGKPFLTDQPRGAISEAKASFIRKVDSDADAIYAAALGSRATEYSQAELEACSYKDAGYEGVVPPCVLSWAEATGKSIVWATDNIIATAQAWRNAQSAIRSNRLKCKEDARRATTLAELDAVSASWGLFLVAIRSQLGL